MVGDGDRDTERQLIESRINLLLKCLQEVEVLRSDTDILRKRIKENLNHQSFETIQTKLSQLETQIFARLDKKLFRSQIDMPLNSLEYEMHQLINNLSSAAVFSRRDQFSILNNTDFLIKQMLTRMSDIERYKQGQENLVRMNKYSELNENLNLVLEKMKKLLEEETPKIMQDIGSKNSASNQEISNSKMNDIKQWLLVTNNANNNNGNTSSSPDQSNASFQVQDEKNSFDFVDMSSELESIEVINDFDESSHDYRYWLLDRDNVSPKRCKSAESTPFVIASSSKTKNDTTQTQKQSTGVKKSTTAADDGFSRTFDEISSKPINYWLLNQS